MPLRLYNVQGDIAWSAHYTIFGQTDKLDETQVKQPLRLQGQYFDEESGLHYNRHRYYDPATGVFVSQDPIGLVGGLNPYQFAINTLSWVDPLGLIRLRHYTSNKGLEGIQKDKKIIAYDQNKVFTEKAKGKPLSAADAADKYGIAKKDARNIVEFDIDDSRVEKIHNPITQATEYVVEGDIDLDEKSNVKCTKRNQ